MMYKDDYFQEWIDEDEYSRRLDLISVRWELRGYGSSAVEAAADGWEKFKNIDDWYMYGYTTEGEQNEDS